MSCITIDVYVFSICARWASLSMLERCSWDKDAKQEFHQFFWRGKIPLNTREPNNKTWYYNSAKEYVSYYNPQIGYTTTGKLVFQQVRGSVLQCVWSLQLQETPGGWSDVHNITYARLCLWPCFAPEVSRSKRNERHIGFIASTMDFFAQRFAVWGNQFISILQ